MVVNRASLALAASLVLVASSAWASGLPARLGHTTVREGERVQLQLRLPADGSMVAPDLAPLEEDFEILGTQQSHRLSIVNGRREASVDWTVTLLPRATGDVVVPAIHAGSLSSEPLRLRVAEAGPPPSRADAPDLFVESSVDRDAPYVQGEVRYSVKVYDGIGIRGGGLSEPHVDNARVTPMGEGRTYEETVHGRRYRVHEREYSITPQTSGVLVVAPVTLEARIDDPDARRRSPFDEFFGGSDPFAGMFGRSGFGSSLLDDMFNPGRKVRVRSNPVELDVRARPDAADEGWFLPARHVELAETFEPATPSFRVGEAVKRTVVLRALGASAEQLPAFEIPSVSGVRQYDEGSRDGSLPTDDGIVSVREQTVALVPSQPGRATLPAVEVSWWDAEAEEGRTASLPAREIEILPAAGTAAPGVHPAEVPVEAATVKPASADAVPPLAAEASGTGALDDRWLLVAAVVALVLAAGGGFAFARRGTPSGTTPGHGAAPPTAPALLKSVRAACDGNDAAAVRDALVRWSRASFGVGAPGNPRTIARALGHPGFEEEAAKLDRSLYAPGADAFTGASFWRAFDAARRSSVRADSPARGERVLPELYPST